MQKNQDRLPEQNFEIKTNFFPQVLFPGRGISRLIFNSGVLCALLLIEIIQLARGS